MGDSNDIYDSNISMRFKGLTGRKIEKTWLHRACVIYFYLHNQSGNHKRQVTCNVCGVSRRTIGT